MNKPYWNKLLLTSLLTATCAISFAQQSEKDTWKKRVTREINIQTKQDSILHGLTQAAPDTTLLELIVNAIKKDRITAWAHFAPFDPSFKLTYDELDYSILHPHSDDTTFVEYHNLDYRSVHKYRLLEEWTFNSSTGNTSVHIEGIAPVRDFYGADGDFHGSQALFWVRYNDILPILQHHDQLHPDNNLALYIWNDYFYSDVKPVSVK